MSFYQSQFRMPWNWRGEKVLPLLAASARKFPSWNVGIDSALESDGRGAIPQVAARNSAPEEAETTKLPAAPIASPDQSDFELITKVSAEQCSLVVCVRHSNFCCRQVWFVLVLLKLLISRERFNCAKFSGRIR
jgi:hypothetical protein